MEAVTGTGKSMVGVAAIWEAVSQGGYVLVVVPTKALAMQWIGVIRSNLPRLSIGQVGDGHKDSFDTHQVVVGTVQSLSRKPVISRSLTLVIADEVHRYGASKWSKAFLDNYKWRLGLTATYERVGDSGVEDFLNPYFSKTVFSYQYAEALKDGVVAPFNLAFIGLDFSLQERLKYEDCVERADRARKRLLTEFDYEPDWPTFFSAVSRTLKSPSFAELEEVNACRKYMKAWSERRMLTASASAKYELAGAIAEGFNRRSGTLVFGATVDSVNKLAAVIGKATSVVALSGKSTNEEREKALERFKNGECKVVCAPQILNEGIDVPDAEVAVIIGASQTKREMIQRMGRVIRLKEGNRPARILIAYMKGTPEDPTTGGHEAFLSEVRPHTFDPEIFFTGSESAKVRGWIEEDMVVELESI